MIRYKTTITTITIIAQIDKLVKNCFNFKLVFKKAGSTSIRTAIKEIAGMI
jgi:CRISPR/Cas system-associated endonuclease/helicase Cas3